MASIYERAVTQTPVMPSRHNQLLTPYQLLVAVWGQELADRYMKEVNS